MTGDLSMTPLSLPLILRALIALVPALVLSGQASAAPQGPENVEWVLVKLGSAPVPTLPGSRQPSLRLDAAKKQATGYAGCNNFFGGYELVGAALKFGPLAATRRACPDPESAVETRYLEALAKVSGWKYDAGELLLVNNGAVLARLATKPADASTPDLQTITLRSRAYTASPVTLTRGEYRAPAAPDSASEVSVRLTDHQAFKTLSGKEYGVVVVATSLGGSGTYSELALLSKADKGWTNTHTVLLGDRVRIQSIAIEKNVVVIDMLAHASRDPVCCPTQQTQKRYAIRNGKLAAVEQKKESIPSLTGKVWQWTHTRYNNDQRTVPARPEHYTLQFSEDGQINVKADCNLKGGTYALDDKKLTLTLRMSTMAACEPGSLEDEFVRNLTAATIYFFMNGDLFLDLKADTGTMRFSARQ